MFSPSKGFDAAKAAKIPEEELVWNPCLESDERRKLERMFLELANFDFGKQQREVDPSAQPCRSHQELNGDTRSRPVVAVHSEKRFAVEIENNLEPFVEHVFHRVAFGDVAFYHATNIQKFENGEMISSALIHCRNMKWWAIPNFLSLAPFRPSCKT